jgi:hypothetical protein
LKKASAAASSINNTLMAISALVTLAIIILISVTVTNTVTYAQLQNILGLKITSHEQGQEVPVGELTISGTSTDNATSDCIVYADVNNTKPFQKAIATDYSTWTFTYTDKYHLITNGTNELTAKLSCVSSPTNLTKWNSVIVVGVMNTQKQQQQQPPMSTSIVNDSTVSDNNTTLGNRTAALAGNDAAPFMFPLPSENTLSTTSSENKDTIDDDKDKSNTKGD